MNELGDIRQGLAELQRSMGRIEGQTEATAANVTLLRQQHDAFAASMTVTISKMQTKDAYRTGKSAGLGAMSGLLTSIAAIWFARFMNGTGN